MREPYLVDVRLTRWCDVEATKQVDASQQEEIEYETIRYRVWSHPHPLVKSLGWSCRTTTMMTAVERVIMVGPVT